MIINDNEFAADDNQQEQQQNDKPNAYRVDDDDNLTEEDLQHSYPTSKSDMKDANAPGMEGQGMGGHSFGENNLTPSGDDPANPSQNAGYNNEYFRRTQPSEEHPENNNFKDPDQQGRSNYSAANGQSENGEKPADNEGNEEPDVQQGHQEGTADNDGNNDKKQENIPGPNEIPDQQKVGE